MLIGHEVVNFLQVSSKLDTFNKRSTNHMGNADLIQCTKPTSESSILRAEIHCRMQTGCGAQTSLLPNRQQDLFPGQGITPTIHLNVMMKAEKLGGLYPVPKRKKRLCLRTPVLYLLCITILYIHFPNPTCSTHSSATMLRFLTRFLHQT